MSKENKNRFISDSATNVLVRFSASVTNSATNYVYNVLVHEDACLSYKGTGEHASLKEEVSKRTVYLSCVDWCEVQKIKYIICDAIFWKEVRKLIPSVNYISRRVENGNGKRELFCSFPSIEIARREFEKSFKPEREIDWNNELK